VEFKILAEFGVQLSNFWPEIRLAFMQFWTEVRPAVARLTCGWGWQRLCLLWSVTEACLGFLNSFWGGAFSICNAFFGENTGETSLINGSLSRLKIQRKIPPGGSFRLSFRPKPKHNSLLGLLTIE